MGVLSGVRVVEIAGIGPGPFCGMLLADLGAEVTVIERKAESAGGPRPGNITHRGKRSIEVDLKSPDGVALVLRLLRGADALIEGMRPGVMERLGLGPDVCLQTNPALVYGRMTGWGQYGPMAHAAGHDSNYLSLAGTLWWAGGGGIAPKYPSTLVGDIGGGALYLAVGLLAGILNARGTGKGQVVDAAIVDGAAHLTNLILMMRLRHEDTERQRSGSPSPHWADTYPCAGGGYITLASLEPKFYQEMLRRLGLDSDPDFIHKQHDASAWPRLRARLADLFMTRTRDEWCELLEGTDACFAPVLSPEEAHRHPHNAVRGVYVEQDGVLQAAPAPRFSGTPSEAVRAVPASGQGGREVLIEAGFSAEEIGVLQQQNVIRVA